MLLKQLRRWSWRLGRKLYCWARGDLANAPETNGEYWLLAELANVFPSQGLLLDVGANKGDWSLRALSLIHGAARETSIYAFEPCAATRSILVDRFSGFANVEVFPFALAATEGEADFFSSGAGVGTNSLSSTSGALSERVQVITLDSFVAKRGIDRISMLKVDTEGYDLDVLLGARQMLAEGRIDIVQFEYNWRWLLNKASLLDVFTFIQDMPYRLGKLRGGSIEYYETWHFELDRFFENNYVLVRKSSSLERLGKIVRFDSSNCPDR
jgi:FkbM family methyltransferase